MDKNRQVIYVEVDQELTSVLSLVKGKQEKTIYLVVPKKAILFQSAINLRILKNKLKKRNKSLVIVTVDRNGKHMAKKNNIPVMDRIEINPVKKPMVVEEDIAIKIQPIQARRNLSLKEERPQRVTDKKLSIRELIDEFRLKDKKRKKNADHDLAHGGAFSRPGRKFLILIIFISTSLFGLIGYIALPSATVYIRPKFDHIDFTANIVLADKRKNQSLLRQSNPRYIASEEISTTIKQTKVFKTASKEFKGENSRGKIKIINTTDEDWELRGGTRFQSEEGIIYRMESGVVVPPRKAIETGDLIPGTLVVDVEADPFDIYNKPVGRRGNLPPTKFTIPALSKYNQLLIWGESSEPMKGGVTDYKEIVTAEDIEASKKQLQDNLIMLAKEDLNAYIQDVNDLNKTKLTLLDDNRYLKTDLVEMKISDDLEGSYQEKFEIYAEIEATGIAFDFDQLFSLLKDELGQRTHPSMVLREGSISPENITYEVIDYDENIGQLKVTATVVGIEEFAIDSSTQNGIEFGDRIKEKIANLDLETAESIVGNLPEVDMVEIKAWPIWMDKIPRLTERINVRLME